MGHEFDKAFWEQHWHLGGAGGVVSMADNPVSPYLHSEIAGLVPGTALDAGCGAGTEALWLAAHGWQVTAVDISAEALALAAARATSSGVTERVRWVEADLGDWAPEDRFDLVTSHYAHPEMPQLDFYERIGSWVAPGGTLLLVGHLHVETPHDDGHDGAHGHRPSTTASVTAAAITARLDDTAWQIVTADERQRHLAGHGSRGILHDVVVRARRRTRHGH